MNYPERYSQGSDKREKCRKGILEKKPNQTQTTFGRRGGEINPTENPGKTLGCFARISAAFCRATGCGYSRFRDRKMGTSPPKHDMLRFGELTSLQKTRRFCVPLKVTVRVDGRMHM